MEGIVHRVGVQAGCQRPKRAAACVSKAPSGQPSGSDRLEPPGPGGASRCHCATDFRWAARCSRGDAGSSTSGVCTGTVSPLPDSEARHRNADANCTAALGNACAPETPPRQGHQARRAPGRLHHTRRHRKVNARRPCTSRIGTETRRTSRRASRHFSPGSGVLLADSKSATSPNVARRVACRNPDIEPEVCVNTI